MAGHSHNAPMFGNIRLFYRLGTCASAVAFSWGGGGRETTIASGAKKAESKCDSFYARMCTGVHGAVCLP